MAQGVKAHLGVKRNADQLEKGSSASFLILKPLLFDNNVLNEKDWGRRS